MAESIAPIANGLKLRGKGPVFRRRDGNNWIVFAIERRRLDPAEAAWSTDARHIDFRFIVGLDIPVARPGFVDQDRAPGIHDISTRAPSLALEPRDGALWFRFDATDQADQQALTEVVARGLPQALRALGQADARAVLERRLASAGPLENLAPGHAEELLALAAEAGATDVRGLIVEALQRDPVPDPTRPSWDELVRETEELFGADNVYAVPMPADDEIWEPLRPGRRTAKRRERYLADLRADRTFPRRRAAAALGGWDGEPEIVEALRAVCRHPDDYTVIAALGSLAHLGDEDPATWELALAAVPRAASEPRYLAQAIVQFALLDPGGRAHDARTALGELLERYPAWTRQIRGLETRLPPPW